MPFQRNSIAEQRWNKSPAINWQQHYLEAQQSYGGVAGLFSLFQVGDAEYMGDQTPPTGDRGFIGVGGAGGPGVPQFGAYYDGNTTPLLEGYTDGYGMLLCPADQSDVYYGANLSAQRTYAERVGEGYLKVPEAPGGPLDVIHYNISYLYVVGLRYGDAKYPSAIPLWGDETDSRDISTDAWWRGETDQTRRSVGYSDSSWYADVDNHGTDGANFVFSDGHAEFVRAESQFTVHDQIFGFLPGSASNPDGRVNVGVNALMPLNWQAMQVTPYDARVQTID